MIETKFEILNPKQIPITETPARPAGGQNTKRYDLEDRTLKYAERVRNYIKKLPRSITNIEIGGQMFRSAGSVGANYIEANEALGKKDFAMRIRICRKEAKESRYWLNLSEPAEQEEAERQGLLQEATELMKIFGSILEKCK
ncbi:MAG: four helix bundle protein [Candidatus Margulisiibacteriota bacterium]